MTHYKRLKVKSGQEEDPVVSLQIRRLLSAVLKRALIDLSDKSPIGWDYLDDGSPKRRCHEALTWIFDDHDTRDDWSLTFIQCCDGLGLDPGKVREKVLSEPPEYFKGKFKRDITVRAYRGRFKRV